MDIPESTPHPTPLEGWCVGLVGVAGGRPALRRAFARAGANPLPLPALSLRPAPDPAAVAAQLESLAGAGAWIFVSPAAVRFAWRAAPGLALPAAARVFAVGPGTAAALARHGIAATHPPQRHDSEGLLALPALDKLRGTVALVHAPGGRTLLRDALRDRGLAVREVATYRRVPARWDRRQRGRLDALLRAQPRALWIATSGEALAAMTQLAGDARAGLLRVRLLVGSARLAEVARSLGCADIHVAAGSSTAALLAGALAAIAPRRTRA